MATAPEGWYVDPQNPNEEVYWLGTQWTAARRPRQVPVPAQPPPSVPQYGERGANYAVGAPGVRPVAAAALPSSKSSNTLGVWSIFAGIGAFVFAINSAASALGVLLALTSILLGILAYRAKGRPRRATIFGIAIGVVALIIGITTIAGGHSGSAKDPVSQADDMSVVVPSASATPKAASTPKPVKASIPAGPYGVYPTAEAQFIDSIETAAGTFTSDSTDLQQSEAVRLRDIHLCKITKHKATNWVGEIHGIGANGDGYAYVEVEIAPTIVVQTWNNAFSDIGSDTLIKPTSSVFDKLVPMKEGQLIVFSGTFLRSDASCMSRANITDYFYGTDPHFILKFTKVAAQ